MIGACISTCFIQSKARNAIYLCISYVAQTQDAAHMNVNQRRKPNILEFFNRFNFFTDLFLCVARHLSKLNRVVFSNLR